VRGHELNGLARGPVVNEQDLVDALESGKGQLSGLAILMAVMRAALDVFEHEPEIHPKLRENKNVVSLLFPECMSPAKCSVPYASRCGSNGGYRYQRCE
jgi:lactate dehydrogenase-like 2-hydroxyacid dehydrogenase